MTDADTNRALAIAERVKMTIGDEAAEVIGAVLGNLVAAYLMGFRRKEMRDEVYVRWVKMLSDLLNAMEQAEKPSERMQ